MATCTLTIHVAWWAKHYIMALTIMREMTGMEPNWDRVSYWVGKGVKARTSNREGWDG